MKLKLRAESPIMYVGSKRGHLRHLLPMLEPYLGLPYTEPFFGGGSVGLALLANEVVDRNTALLADESPSVVGFWTAVRDEPRVLMRMLQTAHPDQDRWEAVRDKMVEFNRVWLSQRRLILDGAELAFCKWYWHRWSFNTLRRTFAVGNAPKLSAVIRRVWDASHYLRGVGIKRQDFAASLGRPGLAYNDPPYRTENDDWAGQHYERPFEEEDHEKLARLLRRRADPWVLSYDAHRRVAEQYAGCPIDRVRIVERMAAANEGAHHKVEFVVTNT